MTLAVLLAITSGFLYAVTNVVDKVIVSRHITRPILVVIFGSMMVGIIGLTLFPFAENVLFAHFLLLILSTVFVFSAATIYFTVLKNDEPSRIVPLFGFITIFVTILSAIFLGELFAPLIYTGIGAIFVGGWIITIRSHHFFSPFQSQSFVMMIVSSFLWATSVVILKFLLGFYPVVTLISYDHIIQLLMAVVLLPFFKEDLWRIWTDKRKYVYFQWTNELIAFVAMYVFLLAASLWFVTLVSAIGTIQYLFIFLFALILHRFRPELFNEEVNRKVIAQKLFAIALIIGGIFLISL